jgi:hypothetical protein
MDSARDWRRWARGWRGRVLLGVGVEGGCEGIVNEANGERQYLKAGKNTRRMPATASMFPTILPATFAWCTRALSRISKSPRWRAPSCTSHFTTRRKSHTSFFSGLGGETQHGASLVRLVSYK